MHVYSDVQYMQAQRTKPMGHRGSLTYRDKMYVQRTNHMGLWGHNACTKEQSYRDTRYLCVQKTHPMGIDAQIDDQSYEHTMHVQSSNPMGRCIYMLQLHILMYM